jgi:hypothetical protein
MSREHVLAAPNADCAYLDAKEGAHALSAAKDFDNVVCGGDLLSHDETILKIVVQSSAPVSIFRH